jgi:putative NADPH-quinone reductase
MKVLALNGSPRGEKSTSQRLLGSLLDGLREAGADVTQHYLAQLDIHPCTGCFGCWLRTPGQCSVWRDSMDGLLAELEAADWLIMAYPLYVYNMPAQVKLFYDRLIPGALPWIVPHPTRPGLMTHPRRFAGKGRKLVVICNAGLCELEHFGPLKATLEYIASQTGMAMEALILKPGGGLLQHPLFQDFFAPYYAALTQAGRELAAAGGLSPETRAALAQEYIPIPAEEYYAQANAHFQQTLIEHGHDGTPPPTAPMPGKAG